MGSFPREERVNCNFFPLFFLPSSRKDEENDREFSFQLSLTNECVARIKKRRKEKEEKRRVKRLKYQERLRARTDKRSDTTMNEICDSNSFYFFFSLFSTKKKRYFDVTQNRKHGSFLSDYLPFRLPFRFVREFLAGVVFKRRNVEKKEKKVNSKLASHHVQSLIWSR